MGEKDLRANVRAELTTEREHLVSQLSDLGVSNDGPQAFDGNFADSAQVAAEQGEARALATTLAENLREVEAALARLDDGTYGQCSSCQGQISDARLEAMPMATTCIDCAS